MILGRRVGDDGERPLALGPSGRPLHPVGALFEAAFRRFGQRFGAYMLYTIAAALPAAATAYAVGAADLDGWPVFFAVGLVYALGHLALVGLLAGLVAGELRRRAASIAVAVIAGGVVLALLFTLLPPLALAGYPFLVFGPIAAAAGDGEGRTLGAVGAGARVAGRWLGRGALVVVGLVMVGLFVWFGFVIALTPLDDTAQQVGAFGAVTLVVWPVAALVERNLYGDLTGRLVIREAPGEDERQADLERRGRRRD